MAPANRMACVVLSVAASVEVVTAGRISAITPSGMITLRNADAPGRL